MSLGALTIVNESASVGPVKYTRITLVGDGAYVSGGSVGFADKFNAAAGEKREIVHVDTDGSNGDIGLEYAPQGNPFVVTAVASTDLLTTVTPQPLNAAAVPVAHGFSAGDPVEFDTFKNGNNANFPDVVLPTPLAVKTVYYVIASGLTTTSFKVSATSGGSALDLTDGGFGRFYVRKGDKLLVRVPSTGSESGVSDQSGTTYKLFVTSK